MKFGDIVVNGWAGNKNPQKVLMVVHHGRNVKCLSTKGSEVIFRNDKNLRLTKIGSLDFSEWLAMARSQHEQPND